MTEEDEERFKNQDTCDLCKSPFKSSKDKNRHHNHHQRYNNFVGGYCSRCNLQLEDKSHKLVLVAHNMSYDVRLILKEMSQDLPVDVMCKHELKFFLELT